MNYSEKYKKEFIDHNFDRLGLFEELNTKFSIQKVLYLGSYIHITPSLVYPTTVYVDSFRKTDEFFKDEAVMDYIDKNQLYSAKSSIKFIKQDYNKPLDIDKDFDLLISQYAGFVSLAGKQYLRKGGILLTNNSHGDATMANLDKDFEFIGVANLSNENWKITDKNLGQYFIRKKGTDTEAELLKTMKGPGYTKTASNYIFMKK